MIEYEGVEEGEVCNRNGCKGIIEEREHQLDGCSCHDNPPCSYCTENLAYCPECDWDSDEEDIVSNVQRKPYSMNCKPKEKFETKR